MIIKHSYIIDKQVRQNGDLDSVVVEVATGEPIENTYDRFKLTIDHGLGRIPVAATIIWSDKFTNCRVIDSDKSKIILQFNAERAKIRLEIW